MESKDIKLNISPPWITYYHEIEAMFKEDPEIKVRFDEDNHEVKMFVDNTDKAYALAVLLPPEKEFGNVKVKVTVIPSNISEENDTKLLQRAFKGNPVLSYIREAAGPLGMFNYVVFRNEVVQFFNDDISDAHGVMSTLYEDIAMDLFNVDGAYFCTDINEQLGKPLGEWP
jgi:hypothetical protein